MGFHIFHLFREANSFCETSLVFLNHFCPGDTDSDGDGQVDSADEDDDNDGLLDTEDDDDDGDGVQDEDEDNDGDGLTNDGRTHILPLAFR